MNIANEQTIEKQETELTKLTPSKGILAILVVFISIGVILAIVFLTRTENEPSKGFCQKKHIF